MSYTTVLRMPKDGGLLQVVEFKNAYGSAMRVWDSLVRAHLIDPMQDVDQQIGSIMFSQRLEPLWKLIDSPKLSRVERMLLGWTFDKAVCEYAKLTEMAKLFREFEKLHRAYASLPPGSSPINHLPSLADLYEKEAQEPEHLGLCVIQTSVSCDVWRTSIDPEDEDSESRMYDASKDKGHYFIFEQYDKEPALTGIVNE